MTKKLKTRKFIAKRVRIKKSGKIIKKKAGQDHFNSREKGKISRNKRRNNEIKSNTALYKSIKKLVPYF